MIKEKIYTGTYKLVKIFRVSRRRKVIKRNLSIEQAKTLVNSYPDKSNSMVVFMKQFYADKYFINQ